MSTEVVKKPVRRRWLRRVLQGGAVVLLLLAIAGGVCHVLAHRSPGWYKPLNGSDGQVDLVAANAEQRFLLLRNQAENAAVKDETWSISQDEINALLAVRYAVAEGKEGMTEPPQVVFSPGLITLAIRHPKVPGDEPGGGVLSVDIKATTVAPDPTRTKVPGNQLLIAIERVYLHSLPLPEFLVRKRIDAAMPQLTNAMRQVLAANRAEKHIDDAMEYVNYVRKGEPFTPKPSPDPRRRVQIKSIRVTDGRFELTMGPEGK